MKKYQEIIKTLTPLQYKVTQENEFLLKNMKVYENIIEKDRIKNHENKNQLIVIKNMVHKNNNKLLNYLDNMNKEKYLKDESILLKLKNIPKGLRGLIYSKIIEAESKNINHFVSIEKNINKITDKFEIKMFNDILNIIGTLFDNAIDAASETEKKIVNFEMFFINDELKIVISNTFSGFINLEKIEKNGYTTKEKGHGYGLSLVNNILNKNKKIFKKTKINNNIFIQEIKIVI